MRHRISLFLLISLATSPLALASGEKGQVMLPGASIKGIEANPRVTFIVPWQRSRMKDFPLLPAHSALDDLYTPLSSRQLELDLELQQRRGATQP